MANNFNQYEDLDDLDKKGNVDTFFENVGKFFTQNRLVKYLSRKVLLRKTLIFYALLFPIIGLILGGIYSPARETFSKEQLETKQEFGNGTGRVELVSQTYSKSNGIMVFEFETTDYTAAIQKGINANNLEWQLFTPPGVDAQKTQMEVVPLTDNKIDVIVRNVPKDYGVMIVRIANTTVSNSDVDVSIQDYEDYKEKKKEKKLDQQETTDYVDFYITHQNGKLKYSQLENLSRENFALKAFGDELKFQKDQVKKLEKAVDDLTNSIEEDKATVEQLQREGQYLVGSKLDENQENVEDVQKDMDSKARKIEQAKDNINTLNSLVTKLESNINQIKDGSYEFNAPVQSIKKEIE